MRANRCDWSEKCIATVVLYLEGRSRYSNATGRLLGLKLWIRRSWVNVNVIILALSEFRSRRESGEQPNTTRTSRVRLIMLHWLHPPRRTRTRSLCWHINRFLLSALWQCDWGTEALRQWHSRPWLLYLFLQSHSRALSKICKNEARRSARDSIDGTHSFSILIRALIDAGGSFGL